MGCFTLTVRVRPTTSSEAAKSAEFCWWLSVVYGTQDDTDKVICLEELEAIRDVCAGPWTVTGDFNLILSEEDKSNNRIDKPTPIQTHRSIPRAAGSAPARLMLHLELYALTRFLLSQSNRMNFFFPIRSCVVWVTIVRHSCTQTPGPCSRRDFTSKSSCQSLTITTRRSRTRGAAQPQQVVRWHASTRCCGLSSKLCSDGQNQRLEGSKINF